LLDILKQTAMRVLGDFIPRYPECRIIENDSSVYQGTAAMKSASRKIRNNVGLTMRYELQYIEIKLSLLQAACFKAAYATYCHELCHCFGGDASRSFSAALTEAIMLTAQGSEALEQGQMEWEAYFLK
jgi:hypothetical protein